MHKKQGIIKFTKREGFDHVGFFFFFRYKNIEYLYLYKHFFSVSFTVIS